MNAIPTEYAGVNFRSRLEAKWAAFFDLLNWKWDYEPIDLAGYIPDFLLRFHKPLLVEIKPVIDKAGFDPLKAKIERSGWDENVAIFGAVLLETKSSYDGFYPPILGTINVPYFDLAFDGPGAGEITFGRHWRSAPLLFCTECGNPTILVDKLSYKCGVCGKWDGVGGNLRHLDDAEDFWREAGNAVQWKGRRVAEGD